MPFLETDRTNYQEGFSKNFKGRQVNGRPVGSKNKFTTLKSAFIDAFEEIGGVDNLVEWARCNQTEFYRILARLMPRKIHADVNAGFTLVECNREIDEREAKHED